MTDGKQAHRSTDDLRAARSGLPDPERQRVPERHYSVFFRYRDQERLAELLGCGVGKAMTRFRRAWASASYHGDAWWRVGPLGIDVAVNGRSVVGVRRFAGATDEADRAALRRAGFKRRDLNGRERWALPWDGTGLKPAEVSFAAAWRHLCALQEESSRS